MWVLKTHGETFYVNHVECNIPWSTKETEDNPHTKGSIKIKDCLLTFDENNCATISKLTDIDKVRLRNQRLGITRIIFGVGSDMYRALKNNEFKHSPFKNVNGACGTSYVICDLLSKQEVTVAVLKYRNWRIVKPNEAYYSAYEKKGPIFEEDLEDWDIDEDDE